MSATGEVALPPIDARGRYLTRADYSYGVVVAYGLLLLVAVLLVPRSGIVVGGIVSPAYVPLLLDALILFFLFRYLSTHYVIDATYVRARRILGSRRIRLEEVRRIQFANMRDLVAIGFTGSWGWRGRMWSPVVQSFDAIYTSSRGVLITGGDAPLFVSPRDPSEFARELSRRVRSHRGPLAVDDGAPPAAPPSAQ